MAQNKMRPHNKGPTKNLSATTTAIGGTVACLIIHYCVGGDWLEFVKVTGSLLFLFVLAACALDGKTEAFRRFAVTTLKAFLKGLKDEDE